jgi:pyruvate/2-oxoglutarate dehydrogenase complex dihydrolipoamide acyltransferase (E2) component
VLAAYLIIIGAALTRLARTLAGIRAGLTTIRDRTVPVGGVLDDIVAEVDAIEDTLGGLLAAVGGAPSRAADPAVAADPVPPAQVAAEERREPAPATRTVSTAIDLGGIGTTTRTPRPKGARARPGPTRTSRRSRARQLEAAAPPPPRSSQKRGSKRKQLALPVGSAGDGAGS